MTKRVRAVHYAPKRTLHYEKNSSCRSFSPQTIRLASSTPRNPKPETTHQAKR